MMEPTQSQSRIPELRKELLSSAQSDIVQRIEATRGRVPTPFKIWIQNPTLAEPLQELGAVLTKGIILSKQEREIAILMIARHWGAEYVLATHSREALEAGLPEATIAELREGGRPQLSDQRQQSVCAIVTNFVLNLPTSDATFNDAVAALGQAGVAELVALCGYFTTVALAMKLYQMPLPAK